MEKIVLVSEYGEEEDLLISCLRIMFPECEIQFSPKGETNLDKWEKKGAYHGPSH